MIENKTDILFEELAEELDITPSLFEKAEKRYQSVGTWLNREGSYLNKLGIEAEIFLQGSAKLGTITKPIEDEDEYDIDAVCQLLNVSKKTSTQKQVKDTLGKDIIAYAKAKNMNEDPKNGKRCWTLNYHDEAQFYMDFLPSIPDSSNFGIILESYNYEKKTIHETTIAITDKTSSCYNSITDDWNVSNPKGYFEWFKGRMEERYNIRKNALAESYNIEIEEVPDYKIKTSLQKAIQILKRHRDIYFKDNVVNKVSSVIITTLSAHAYTGNPSLSKTLIEITTNMSNFIIKSGDEYKIINPVNPLENFSDKWINNSHLEEAFRNWLKEVKQDILNIINEESNVFDDSKLMESCKDKFGNKSFNNAFGRSLSIYEKKYNRKAGIILGTSSLSKVVKPYGCDGCNEN